MEHESPPITIRPGLPPIFNFVIFTTLVSSETIDANGMIMLGSRWNFGYSSPARTPLSARPPKSLEILDNPRVTISWFLYTVTKHFGVFYLVKI